MRHSGRCSEHGSTRKPRAHLGQATTRRPARPLSSDSPQLSTGGLPVTLTDAKRRLLWHGMLIVGLGSLTGSVVPVLSNPRMGVAAHVGGLMSGMLLLLVGLIWGEIRLLASAGFVGRLGSFDEHPLAIIPGVAGINDMLLRTAKYGDTPDQQPQGGSAAPLCGKPSAFRPGRQKTSFLFWAPVAERLSLCRRGDRSRCGAVTIFCSSQ